MITKRVLYTAFVLLFSVRSFASHVSVSVAKMAVEMPDSAILEYVTFADEQPVVDVVVSIYRDHRLPSSERGLREFRELSPTDWWRQVEWTLRNTATGVSRSISAGTFEVVRASSQGVVVNGTVQHRGTFRMERLVPGDYALRVSVAGIDGEDTFAVRTGSESPFIRDKYLERMAARTAVYSEFRRIQLERLEIMPKRADILLDLGRRCLEQGTLEEATDYYDRASVLMQSNAADFATNASAARGAEIQQRLTQTLHNIRALRAALPSYFARRGELRVVEEAIDGEIRFVLKERRTGKTVRVIRE